MDWANHKFNCNKTRANNRHRTPKETTTITKCKVVGTESKTIGKHGNCEPQSPRRSELQERITRLACKGNEEAQNPTSVPSKLSPEDNFYSPAKGEKSCDIQTAIEENRRSECSCALNAPETCSSSKLPEWACEFSRQKYREGQSNRAAKLETRDQNIKEKEHQTEIQRLNMTSTEDKDFTGNQSSGDQPRNEVKTCAPDQYEEQKIHVFVKHRKKKFKVEISPLRNGREALRTISDYLRIPMNKLRLINRGKLQTELNIMDNLTPNAVFLALGEVLESEDGLATDDIALIMKQLSVERNVAVKALRKTNCVLDAIFEIGNDL